MVWMFGAKVNENGNCNPGGISSTTEAGASTVMAGELRLVSALAAENAATERTAPSDAESSARSRVEMWIVFTSHNTSEAAPILRVSKDEEVVFGGECLRQAQYYIDEMACSWSRTPRKGTVMRHKLRT